MRGRFQESTSSVEVHRGAVHWQFGSSGGVSRFSENLLASLLLTRSMRRRSYGVGRVCFEGSEIVVMFTSALFFRTSLF